MAPIEMPAGARYLLDALAADGFSAYIVGGCVRDSLLGFAPKDWDVCTSAKPEEVEKCLCDKRIIETGLKHGTVTVLLADGQYEVTTFRVDGVYTDNRRPDSVEFVADVRADLARRDFTVNAMAYSDKEGLVDPFGGREDLQKGVIRCVGDPQTRFCEDGLRIMRALRFASVYGFSIDPETAAAVHKKKDLLSHIAAERIREELCKLLGGKNVAEIMLAYRDCLAVAIPEWEQDPDARKDENYRIAAHALSYYKGKETCVRMALLLQGIPTQSEDMAERIMRRLKFDNRTRCDTVQLVARIGAVTEPTEKAVRRLLSQIGEKQFFRLLDCRAALLAGKGETADGEEMRRIAKARDVAGDLIADGQYVTLQTLAVTGSDVMALDVPEGGEVGRLLHLALEAVLDGDVPNRKDDLIRFLTEKIQ